VCQRSNLLVFLKIFVLQAVNSRIQLNSLCFEMLNLPFERAGLVVFRVIKSILGFGKLTLQIVERLLLKLQFIFDLSRQALLVQFKSTELILQVFDFLVLFESSFADLDTLFILDRLNASIRPFLLLIDP